jgi:DNA-binding helix-hairpin-helix protein with protein kinase domain
MGTLFSSKGSTVVLGKQLGRGGEGAVYEMAGSPTTVIKLYHKPPAAAKQQKLAFMASAVTPKLLEYCSWPIDTLHTAPGGTVTGIVMPRVIDKAPIHMLYSPAHRKQDYPRAGWDFLIYAARNTAAAFEALHDHGHVLGDVNQGNVMVGHDSRVILIDCDSYQVGARGVLHLCEVGVSHFTPPELQGGTSFDKVKRSFNHDRFGLALLIFHLLFGGRHPYAGVPRRKDVGDTLEGDIKAFRYAYGKDAESRGLAPPPNSISLDLVPAAMQAMFTTAFTEPGAQGKRPTAGEWLAVLDSLRSRLRRCGRAPSHLFPDHLPSCPWCALEKSGVVYFPDLTGLAAATGKFAMASVWVAIEAVAVPRPWPVPRPEQFTITGAPLPTELTQGSYRNLFRILMIGMLLGLCYVYPAYFVGVFLLGAIGWLVIGNDDPAPKQDEIRRRQTEVNDCLHNYEQVVRLLHDGSASAAFRQRKQELEALKAEYESLAVKEKNQIDALHTGAHARQLKAYLEGFFVDSVNLPGVGLAKKAALRSWGIETAADITYDKVIQVKGFGPALTRSLVDWRMNLERNFRFAPGQAVSKTDLYQVQLAFAARRRTIEAALLAAPEQLAGLRGKLERDGKAAFDRATVAAEALAKARADREAAD